MIGPAGTFAAPKVARQRLAWDEYWRLVMRLYSEAGIRKSVPEKVMRSYYDEGLSPLQAFEASARKAIDECEGAANDIR